MSLVRAQAALLALALCAAPIARPVAACTTALLLAIDVSNSVDGREYRLQVDGLADALGDPTIAEELVRGQIALMVVQWSGAGQQEVTIPWRRMTGAGEVRAFAEAARAMPRRFIGANTAVGDLVGFALRQFGAVADCRRRVVDISGDGTDNAGTDPAAARRAAERAGVQINALAIEGLGLAITNFYRGQVVTRDGFVMTARGHETYAATLRRKILREIGAALF